MNRLQWVLVGAATLLIVVLIVLRQQKSEAPDRKAGAQQTSRDADNVSLPIDTPPAAVPSKKVAKPSDPIPHKVPETPTPEARVAPTPTPEPNLPPVPPDTPAVLHGTVSHSNGQAVETWNTVWLIADGKEAIRVSAQEDGTFAAAGLAPGRYEAHPIIWSAESPSKTIDLKPGDELEEDFVFRNLREIPIRFVTPGGKPFVKAMRGDKRDSWKFLEYDLAVVVTENAPPPGPPATLGFGHSKWGLGKYSASNSGRRADGRDGTLMVPERWPVYVSVVLHSEVLETRKLTSPPESLTFTIREEQIRSRLSGVTFTLAGDGPRSEIEDGYIMLFRNDRRKYAKHPFEREGDQITIRNKIPGRYCLALWFGDFAEDWSRVIDLTPGKLVDLGTAYLRKATDTPLQVVDRDGDPIADATILPIDLDRDYALQQSELARSTDEEGRFSFMQGPGRYFLAVKTPKAVHFGIDLVAPLPDGESLRIVEPTSNSVNIHMSGSLAEPVRINILAGKGRRVARWSTNVPTLWVSKFGEGEYTAEVIEGDGTTHRKTFQVSADRVPTLFFERAKNK